MRRQKAIQLLQFIIIWVLLGLFVVFVLKESFLKIILRYWLYFLIFSVSYFYYYSIEYEFDSKYKFIRNVLIWGNVYLFLHIFFRPLLNISHQLFVVLGLIVLGIWWSTKLKSRWKYLLQIVGWILSFFILISGMFYFYPEKPDIEGFLQKKGNELKILGVNNLVEKKEAYIQITNSDGNNDFEIVPNFSKTLSENVKISYPSLNKQRAENLLIITSWGDLVWIFPQSEVLVEFEGKVLKKVSKLNGKILFLTGMFSSDLEFIGNDELNQEERDWLEGFQDGYKYEVVSYLKNQISESNISFANNTIMYNLDGIIIKYLSKIFPVSFGKNLSNYNEFQKYFNRVDQDVNLGRYSVKQGSGESINLIWGKIKDNMNIGKTNTYGWLKKPQKR